MQSEVLLAAICLVLLVALLWERRAASVERADLYQLLLARNLAEYRGPAKRLAATPLAPSEPPAEADLERHDAEQMRRNEQEALTAAVARGRAELDVE